MAAFDDVVIISGCRTPVGKFQGSLSDLSAPQLGAIVVREAVKRARDRIHASGRMHHGQRCLQPGSGQNPARQAAIFGGLRSGGGCHDHQQGVWLRTESRRARGAGDPDRKQFHRRCRRHGIDDQRSLPVCRKRAKDIVWAMRQIVDSMVHDGLWDIYNDYHMGITGENVAEKYGITREEQDEFALNSHRKALAAIKECRFKSQIVPVELPGEEKGRSPT